MLLELFNGVSQRRGQERLINMFTEMRNCLNRLGEEKVDHEYFRSEEFQTLLCLLAEKIQTTHDAEKLKLFGSSLANSARLDFKDEDKEEHIRVLRDLSLKQILNDRNLKGWTPHVNEIVYDPEVQSSLFRLQGMGLLLVTEAPTKTFYLSAFGTRFLRFISAQENSSESST